MLDIIKEYLKLNRSLVLLPLKAARRLTDDRNTGARQMMDFAEDVVSAPFVAAEKAIDNSCRNCAAGSNGTVSSAAETTMAGITASGPGLRNVLVNPEVTVSSDSEPEPGLRKSVLTVTGLLCGA